MKTKSTVIGQDKLISNIDKIFKIFKHSDSEIRPHFILGGPSGSGKSLTIATLAAQNDIKFLEINGAQLTKEGTSGNSLSKALTPLLQIGSKQAIVFVDEFDKLFISGNNNTELAHESTNGVQNEFLKVLESDHAAVFGDYGKYINASVGNVLFVFAGAFNNEEDITIDKLRDMGVKTEFLGRVGLVFTTKRLTLENLFDILENEPLLNMYLELFEDIDRETVILKIKSVLQKNYENNTLGARMIKTLISQYFINGGVIDEQQEKSVVFNKKLKLD